MTLDDESKIIVQAIDKTLFDFKKYSDRIVNEEQIKLRLYQNICNMLGDDSFIYITGEYPVFTKVQQKENRDYATNHGRNKNYIDCIKKLPNLEAIIQLAEDCRIKREEYILKKIVNLDMIILGYIHAEKLGEYLFDFEYVKTPWCI